MQDLQEKGPATPYQQKQDAALKMKEDVEEDFHTTADKCRKAPELKRQDMGQGVYV